MELYKRFEKGDEQAGIALEWIAKYNNEYYKGFLKKSDPTAIHNTPELYKEATDSQNARRRDIIGAIKSGSMGPHASLVQLEEDLDALEDHLNSHRDFHHEEVLVSIIGFKISHNL
jgi:hypothetical protein